MNGYVVAISYNAEPDAYRLAPSQSVKLTDGIHYSIMGQESRIAILTKNRFQLFSDCGFTRDNFMAQLANLASVESAHLVLETTISDIYDDPPAGSRMPPHSVFSSLTAWAERYAVIPWFCGDRAYAEHVTRAILDRWYRDHVLGEHSESIYRRARRQAKKYIDTGEVM